MTRRLSFLILALMGIALAVSSAQGDLTDSLKKGTPELKSIGPIAFGADGVLFVSDSQGAGIFAIDTGDRANTPATGTVKIPKVDEKIAAAIGATAKDINVNDLAVNPSSGSLYLSVSRGKGPTATPVLVKIDRQGKVSTVELKDVKFARADLPSASDKNRQESVTCLAYVKGKVLVSGLSNENWASTLRAIPFPFTEANKPTQVQIFHGAHGKFETQAPVRTFVPFDVAGKTNILAAYQCTPLVKFPIDDLKPGAQVKGTTVAELGNGNRPLDMISYEKGGKSYLLITNSKRGMMKVPTEGIDKAEAITSPAKSPSGIKYETIKELEGVLQMDRLDKDNAVILKRDPSDGSLTLDTVPLP
jgi:hypothetical protein